MKYKNNLTQFDNTLFFLTILAGIVGIIAVFSATRSMNTNSNVIMQTAAFVIGIILMFFISRINYQIFGYTAVFIYVACILMLIAVLIFGTTGTWGARSWIRFGPIGLQPSEVCKIGFALTFAKHLATVKDDLNKPVTLAFLVLHLAVLAVLIMLEPDAGSTMVFCFMAIAMLFVAGLSVKYILPTFLLFLASSPLIYFFLLSDYQKRRIQVFFNPELDKLGSGYNVIQSKIAVGSGKL
ncbi:MAG: FtsW/RodA/SpoVE family cell cycle protein, partial [Clostridia bacterium]|nr:FtsW/RodA/SpoVE family cell cycle protein [Clostridia bacterium]